MKRSREPEEEPLPQENHVLDHTFAERPDFPASKISGLDDCAIDDSPPPVMRCSMPPHSEPLAFRSYGDFESHYQQAHTNRCADCRKNFPSEHLLCVHIEECHDAFAAVLRDKGEHTYSCFVEGCERKCRTPQKRRMHLIDKHTYPKNYFFAVTKDGVDGRSSLLLERGHHRRKSSSASQATKGESGKANTRQPGSPGGPLKGEEAFKEEKDEVSAQPKSPANKEIREVEMEDLTGAMSSLHFVPTSVRFGRGKGKTGFAKK